MRHCAPLVFLLVLACSLPQSAQEDQGLPPAEIISPRAPEPARERSVSALFVVPKGPSGQGGRVGVQAGVRSVLV